MITFACCRFYIKAGLLILLLLPNTSALACSSEDRSSLAMMGYTSEQIDAQCGSGGNPFVTPSMPIASYCVTAVGSCYLNNRVAVGSQCWCPTGYGNAVYGVAR
ncbi:hypothetical protein NP590_19440 [Methylomonas sp. SURF-2]|uniref:Thyroglobulin type-1 domain-containing protein n=1 Tax=Methylomonas subterranea TaxID=2952225 RepID=A0ABT1TLE8_9GAMM|nr:hypothetical protein [Methylomonas sp. SURF-2]MCQ8106288.1 hypothetical protein [Methylomonas sp. SURF-2]